MAESAPLAPPTVTTGPRPAPTPIPCLIPSEKYVLRLYVTGLTPRSTRAIRIVRELCESHLAGWFDLEVIDVYQMPERIKIDDVVAIPTLVKFKPGPVRRIVGDMSNRDRLLSGLGLPLND